MLRVQATPSIDADTARADLQSRLASLFKLMFWSFAALLVFLWCLYRVYPEKRPAHQDWVYVIGAGGLAIMGVLWRGVLTRKPLRREVLHAIYLFYAMGTGSV